MSSHKVMAGIIKRLCTFHGLSMETNCGQIHRDERRELAALSPGKNPTQRTVTVRIILEVKPLHVCSPSKARGQVKEYLGRQRLFCAENRRPPDFCWHGSLLSVWLLRRAIRGAFGSAFLWLILNQPTAVLRWHAPYFATRERKQALTGIRRARKTRPLFMAFTKNWPAGTMCFIKSFFWLWMTVGPSSQKGVSAGRFCVFL